MRTFRNMSELRRALFPKAEAKREKEVKVNPFPERKEIVSIQSTRSPNGKK